MEHPVYLTRKEFLKIAAVTASALFLTKDQKNDKLPRCSTFNSTEILHSSQKVELIANSEEFQNLRGACATHFLWNDGDASCQNNFFKDVDALDEVGGNFLSIVFNIGLIGSPKYLKDLSSAIKHAKFEKNLRVGLTLHSRGIDKFGNPEQIISWDGRIIDDWRLALRDFSFAETVNTCVDVINPLSEPVYSRLWPFELGGSKLTGPEMITKSEEFYNLIVKQYLNKNKLVSISGAHWASDLSVFTSRQPSIPNLALEVHIYGTPGETSAWKELSKSGVPVIVGETGYIGKENQPRMQSLRNTLEYCVSNNIPYVGWGLNRMRNKGDGQNILNFEGNLNAVGEVFKHYNKKVN